MSKNLDRDLIVNVPREFALGSFFPPEGSSEPFEYIDKETGTIFEVNCKVKDLPEDYERTELSTDHLILLIAILYLHSTQNNEDESMVYFTKSELIRLTGRKQGKASREAITKMLWDLKNAPFSRIEVVNGITYRTEYQIIKNFITVTDIIDERNKIEAGISHKKTQEEFEFVHDLPNLRKSCIWIETKFLPVLNNTLGVNLSVAAQMNSALASAIYIYLNPKASHHDSKSPWEISLVTLFENVRFNNSSIKYKSQRKKVLTQKKKHGKSILEKLDYAPALRNKILRVKLLPTKDGKDYKILTWQDELEQSQKQSNESQLLARWLTLGGTEETYKKAVQNAKNRTIEVGIHSKLIRLGLEKELEQDHRLNYWCIISNLCHLKFPYVMDEVTSTILSGINEKRINPKDIGAYLTESVLERLETEFRNEKIEENRLKNAKKIN